jgi:hypothetical protein
MNTELLVVPDCPDAQPAADRLRQVLDGMGRSDVTSTTRVIADQAEAESAGAGPRTGRSGAHPAPRSAPPDGSRLLAAGTRA